MPSHRPAKSRYHDLVNLGREVFGAEIDKLAIEVDRLTGHEGPAHDTFLGLITTWPLPAAGQPANPEVLIERLETLRDNLTVGSVTTTPPAMAAPGPGSPLSALFGAVLGGGIGLPLGFLAYMVAREVILPTDLWSSDSVMWNIIGLVMAVAAWIGARQGYRPSRGGHVALRSLLGFFVGALASGLIVGALALTIGELAGVSQREGAFAVGVVFMIVPLAGLIGGAVLAVIMGRRAARRKA